MKLAFNFSLFLFTFLTFCGVSFALSDYQMTKICRKEVKVSDCIKKLQEKRFNLQKGKVIEITVIPYKR